MREESTGKNHSSEGTYWTKRYDCGSAATCRKRKEEISALAKDCSKLFLLSSYKYSDGKSNMNGNMRKGRKKTARETLGK